MRALVSCYVSPDLDGVASAVAYAEFLALQGREVDVGIIGVMHDEAIYVYERFNLSYPASLPNAEGYDDVVLVDASDVNGLAGKIQPDQVVEIVDHRKIHEAERFPRAKCVQIELVGAAATLIAEKYMQTGLSISVSSAILLQSAIISNTLNFKGSVTTPRDVTAAEWLQKTSQLPESFWLDLFTAKSDLSGDKLSSRIDGDFASFCFAGKKIGIAQLEIFGAHDLVIQRRSDLLSLLQAKQRELGLDYMLQNTVDLCESKNFLVATDAATETLLQKALSVSFSQSVAIHSPALLRKQIVPLIKAVLENEA